VIAEPVAVPKVPVAVKVVEITGEDPVNVAVTVFVPAVVPKVHAGAVATPEALVDTGVPEMEPPPDAMAKVTLAPLTTALLASLTTTEREVETAAPAVAV